MWGADVVGARRRGGAGAVRALADVPACQFAPTGWEHVGELGSLPKQEETL